VGGMAVQREDHRAIAIFVRVGDRDRLVQVLGADDAAGGTD